MLVNGKRIKQLFVLFIDIRLFLWVLKILICVSFTVVRTDSNDKKKQAMFIHLPAILHVNNFLFYHSFLSIVR